jgi:hypothetical protein
VSATGTGSDCWASAYSPNVAPIGYYHPCTITLSCPTGGSSCSFDFRVWGFLYGAGTITAEANLGFSSESCAATGVGELQPNHWVECFSHHTISISAGLYITATDVCKVSGTFALYAEAECHLVPL